MRTPSVPHSFGLALAALTLSAQLPWSLLCKPGLIQQLNAVLHHSRGFRECVCLAKFEVRCARLRVILALRYRAHNLRFQSGASQR